MLTSLEDGPDLGWEDDDPRWFLEIHAGSLLCAYREPAALPVFGRVCSVSSWPLRRIPAGTALVRVFTGLDRAYHSNTNQGEGEAPSEVVDRTLGGEATEGNGMAVRGEVLVAIMNNLLDLSIARDEHWYRIPVSSVEKWLKERWPPNWLAFYQTKVFGAEAYAVHYYARVRDIQEKRRWELFPDQRRDERAQRRYWQLVLGELRRLPRPIPSRRWRRIVFIPTTWHKFVQATEINDLYDESPLEDRL